MNLIRNAALYTLLPKVSPFLISIQNNNKTPATSVYSNLNESNESQHPLKPDIGEYIANEDGKIKAFPKIGNEFKLLEGKEFYQAMYMAYGSNDVMFLQDCIPLGFVNEAVVCSDVDYQCSIDVGNCYNFAKGTECGEKNEYEEQFPKGRLPNTDKETLKDNCEEIKNDLLLEPGMRLKEADEECEADEREIISYYSMKINDIHFTTAKPITALKGQEKEYWHKSGSLPARKIDKKIIEDGHIPENDAIYIIKNTNEDFDIFDSKNSDKIRYSNEATPPYDECHRFCYKVQQERNPQSQRQR